MYKVLSDAAVGLANSQLIDLRQTDKLYFLPSLVGDIRNRCLIDRECIDQRWNQELVNDARMRQKFKLTAQTNERLTVG